MNKYIIVSIVVFILISLLFITNNRSTNTELANTEEFTVVLNDDFNNDKHDEIIKNFKSSYEKSLKHTAYPDINVDVKIMNNEDAIDYINTHPDSFGFVDSVDYIA